MNLHPPKSAGLGADGLAGGMPAAAMLEQIQPSRWSPRRLNCRVLKDMATLWAATTFLFLEMPVNATAAHILVPAAAFGGPHSEGWPALILFTFK